MEPRCCFWEMTLHPLLALSNLNLVKQLQVRQMRPLHELNSTVIIFMDRLLQGLKACFNVMS